MIKLGDKICNFVSFYRSSNQSEDHFEDFFNNFELTLEALLPANPFLIIAIGHFNAKSKNWYTGDTKTFEGYKIEALTSQFGLQQIINEPTHIQGKSASCIKISWPLNRIGDGFGYPLVPSPKLPSSVSIC